MPQTAYTGTSGTLLRLTRTGDNAFDRTVLGSFESWSITRTQRLVDHTGPKDSWEYSTPVKSGWTVNITRFVPISDATPDDDDGAAAGADAGMVLTDMALVATEYIQFQGNIGDGTTLTGYCHWTSDVVNVSGEATKETLDLQGWGALTPS